VEHPLLWADVDLSAIANNVVELCRASNHDARLMAVVKADAYGHGSVPVAKTALDAGAAALGVARLREAVPLRSAGFTSPILIFGYTLPEATPELIAYHLEQTVYDLPTAEAMSSQAVAVGDTVRVHIKVDTGMGRLGLLPEYRSDIVVTDGAVEIIRKIAALPGLKLEGLSTHFASADSTDPEFTRRQVTRFNSLLANLNDAGISIPTMHAANSAGIISHPDSHFNMVRAGIAMYGLNPSGEMDLSGVSLIPAMTLKARIIHVKRVPAGFPISYGMTYRTDKETVIATVPVGYADGYRRELSNRGEMLVQETRAPIRGRVCMDLTMLDVGHLENVQIGDEVVVFGRQGNAEISADEVAGWLGTINYEVVSALTSRVLRTHRNSAE
jgi:alanine racemase